MNIKSRNSIMAMLIGMAVVLGLIYIGRGGYFTGKKLREVTHAPAASQDARAR
jgi:hypothetical protein